MVFPLLVTLMRGEGFVESSLTCCDRKLPYGMHQSEPNVLTSFADSR